MFDVQKCWTHLYSESGARVHSSRGVVCTTKSTKWSLNGILESIYRLEWVYAIKNESTEKEKQAKYINQHNDQRCGYLICLMPTKVAWWQGNPYSKGGWLLSSTKPVVIVSIGDSSSPTAFAPAIDPDHLKALTWEPPWVLRHGRRGSWAWHEMSNVPMVR